MVYNKLITDKKGVKQMEYKLKSDTFNKAFMLIMCVLLSAGVVGFIYRALSERSSDIELIMMNIGVSLIFFVLVLYLWFYTYNNVLKEITFNNVNFTCNGVTYTYQQIEEIRIATSRRHRVHYVIYVAGKNVFTFDKRYQGAREFMYYLDFYKVPGTPRWGGA